MDPDARLLQSAVAFTEPDGTDRSLAFYNGEIIQQLFWARLPVTRSSSSPLSSSPTTW